MGIDQLIKWATGLTVTAVATFAAIISYTHLYELSHHQALLPLCVDGMMVAASLVLLAASRAKLSALPLARVALWAGILATVAGNLAYGLPEGWLAGFVSMWPAVCFVLTVETVMQLAKAKRKQRVRTSPVQTDQTGPKPQKTPVFSKESEQTGPPVKTASPGPLPQPSRTPVYATGGAVPHVTPVFSSGGSVPVVVPGIKAIRTELGCGQPIAYEVQTIMREQNVNMHEALQLRNEARENGRSSASV